MSHIIVTGVPPNPSAPIPTGAAPPPRLEINTLITNTKQFSLYTQALQRMYDTPQTKGDSHFQLGGIHGLPFQPWEGAGSGQVAGSFFGGYCTHGTVLFPTWHRPYMAIYEQILHQHAVEIAATYTANTAAWIDAAQQLRMPYWDWASTSVPPPEVISMDHVTIITPNGRLTPVSNPLLSYRFNPIDPSFAKAVYARLPTTLRHPNLTLASPHSNVTEMITDLRSDQDHIRQSIHHLLTRVKTWPAFSNHTPGAGGSASNSIGAIHDGIHLNVGGQGHMSDSAVAAFDPIFYLHHANVDRITALWQALNPNIWVTEGPGVSGTFTLPASALQNKDTDLPPFWNGAISFWDSKDCREYQTKLGYTYPEFIGLNINDKSAVQAAIRAGTRHNFAFAAAAAPAVSASAAELVDETPATQAAPAAAMRAQAPVPAPPTDSAEATFTDWTARIHVNKYAAGCSFSVLIFLGPVPEDLAQWCTSESYVGAQHVFTNSQAEQCENCRNTAEAQIEGFVHLNNAIAARSGLDSFDPEVVEPYLKENLAWRILKVGTVPAANFQKSRRCKSSSSLHPWDSMKHAGTGRHCHEITEGQPGDVAGSISVFVPPVRSKPPPNNIQRMMPRRTLTIKTDPLKLMSFDPSDKELYDLWASKAP
ncbi:hypothetical protein FS837_010910 [Tulasnella sp. UAMH 9824]|nr:hypothetical protein FS837_010910 [Tulasnella sp. UAMH 9824]